LVLGCSESVPNVRLLTKSASASKFVWKIAKGTGNVYSKSMPRSCFQQLAMR